MLVDTHCHLASAELCSQYISYMNRAIAQGIEKVVVPATNAQEFNTVLSLTQEDCIYPALGVHPLCIDKYWKKQVNILEHYVQQNHLIALGEIGLDFLLQELDPKQQIHLFEQQVAIAAEFNLPVIIHSRRANAQVTAILKKAKLSRAGIIHAFSGSYEEALEYIKLGFLLGFGGAATWPRATRLQSVLKRLPIASIALETDSPDMPPAWLAGQRNSPEQLPSICAHLADIYGLSSSEFAAQTRTNVQRLFGWSA